MNGALRFRGPLEALRPEDRAALIGRRAPTDPSVRATAAAIVAQVRAGGDRALRRLARGLDGVELETLEVPASVRRRALDGLDTALRQALERAARNLATTHRAFLPRPVVVEPEPGVTVGRRPDPLARVGLYAPGGRAAYPSSVLMGAIPARIAGVGEIVLCSPPGPDGSPPAVVLAAAELAGVNRVFAAGGAGAIAAMAYGTESIPAVDCVVGPGNAWVAAAKLLVSGHVAIDGPAGPSELLIIADDTAGVDVLAAEMIAQAEHDPEARVLALAASAAQAAALEEALAIATATLVRHGEIVRAALRRAGGVLVAPSLAEATAFAREYAPEHVMLAVADPGALLSEVRHAGTVFLGARTSVVFGDYATGANHVLPTGGAARRVSGLSTETFVRWTTYQRTTPDAARGLARDVAIMARAEGLEGHAAAACAAARGAAGKEPGTANEVPRPLPRPRDTYRAILLHTLEPAAESGTGPIDLSDNVNLWGMPPAAAAALARMAARSGGAGYPLPYGANLKRSLARLLDVTPDMIVVGCGSDDVLDGAIRAFARPGERLAHMAPSFTMIPAMARANGLEPVGVPLRPDLDVDAGAVLAARAAVTYLCSPNNPTGHALGRAALERIVREAEGLVLLDQAYADFADDGGGGRSLLARSRAVLLTRTMSKAFGLAGLRIGYGVGAPEVVREIEKALGPYKLSAAAETAALAALGDGRPWVEARVAEVRRNRDRLRTALHAVPGLEVIPSQANFVLIRLGNGWGPARAVADALARRRLVVRTFSGLPLVGDALRATVGPWELMERLLDGLRAEAPCA